MLKSILDGTCDDIQSFIVLLFVKIPCQVRSASSTAADFHSCQPVQPEFLDKESKLPGVYNISLDIDISHDKMINLQKKNYVNVSVAVL